MSKLIKVLGWAVPIVTIWAATEVIFNNTQESRIVLVMCILLNVAWINFLKR